ncbi:MurR/RpiR family transcriptional regulator [Ruminococcaceae bacterium OttesenSCG-928-D13]|nr:MurR/RpiR family transcriptional regulator [Ruminococcaceae bacterium OttesenSCG-928-D13]
MNSVIVRAREYLNHASETEKGILRFILENPERASRMGTHALAKAVFASPSTIARLCRKMGFENYKDYQRALVAEVAVKSNLVIDQDFEIRPEDSLDTMIGKTVLRSTMSLEDTRNLIETDVVERCVQLLVKAESISFFGVGASLVVGRDAFLKFIRLKKHCQVCDDFDAQLVLAKKLQKNDAAIIISYSGRTQNVVECARALKASGVPTIAITCFVESPLSKMCDYNLFVSATEYSSTAGKLTSRLSQLLVIDIIYLAYIQATYAASQNALKATYIEKDNEGEGKHGGAEPERAGHRDPE